MRCKAILKSGKRCPRNHFIATELCLAHKLLKDLGIEQQGG